MKNSNGSDQIFLGYQEIKDVLQSILLANDFPEDKAELCSRLFAETTLDGVYSHGLNRFPLFIDYVRKGHVIPDVEPVLIDSKNSFERWDGQNGAGNLNAWFCMDRAIKLSKKHVTGIVAVRNTNHWMRGGSYGIQAANRNCIGICTTNTKPNMPAWGSREVKIGNNPFIIAVPHDPYPILLDMAMSQFSYGKIELLSQKGETLPMHGGWNKEMNLTIDPDEILETELALPTGYWKGSGMAIMIDLLVSILSDGLTTGDIGDLIDEYSLSQLFIAVDLDQISELKTRRNIVKKIIDSVVGSEPINTGKRVGFPGKQTWLRRSENLESGIPVQKETWKKIQQLLM